MVNAGIFEFNFANLIYLCVRIIFLFFLMSYGKALARSIIASRELDQLKDDFLSVASHELRTPMTAVKSYIWLAINHKEGSLKEKQKYYLNRALDSTERLIDLVNGLLSISRIESGRLVLNMEKTDMMPLFEEALKELAPHINEKKIKIEIEKKNLATVLADAGRIKEVLLNLIDNALKFSPSSGLISISFEEKNDEVIFQVKDNGAGVQKEFLPHIFEKFNVVKSTYVIPHASRGSGLGLYICRLIVNLHGGRIWAQSEGENRGTTIYFTLKKYAS